MQVFDLARRLAVAAHFLVASALLVFTIASFNSGAAILLNAAVLIVFSAPLIPMLTRASRRAASVTNVSYITRTGLTLGTVFAVVAIGLLLVAAGIASDGEDRLGAALGAVLALWLSSLSMELSRRSRRLR